MKSFMMYRLIHKMQREQILGINEDTTYINAIQTVEEYINGSDWRIKANSNTGYSNAGLVNNSAGKIIANYWLDKIYSKEEGYAHRSGDYHIHDLDCLTGYCAGWSLRVLLDEGFNGVRGRVESAAPNHFREALGQMANFLGILQSEWAGAQAFSSFDTYLAPYVFKDQLSYNEIKKAVRSFIYNLNVPARWGQSPFTNITIDWTVPADLKDQIPTRNQKHLFKDINSHFLLKIAEERGVKNLNDMCYKDFQPEMNLINKAYYEIMTEGDKTGQPFTFPIPTVNITEDFDWYGENTDLLFENSAKVGSSYFQNFIGSQYMHDANGDRIENPKAYKPGHVRSMCCRLQLDLRELLKRGGGLFGSAEMTGSIGVVTINMARLGYLYQSDEIALFNALDHLMELAKSTLEKKKEFLSNRCMTEDYIHIQNAICLAFLTTFPPSESTVSTR
jgi:ribonucleoside-triphosphate reductase